MKRLILVSFLMIFLFSNSTALAQLPTPPDPEGWIVANSDWYNICPPGSPSFEHLGRDLSDLALTGCSWNVRPNQWHPTPLTIIPAGSKGLRIEFSAASRTEARNILYYQIDYETDVGPSSILGEVYVENNTTALDVNTYVLTYDNIRFPTDRGTYARIRFLNFTPSFDMFVDYIYIMYKESPPTPTTTPTATSTPTSTTSPTPVPTTCTTQKSGWKTVWTGSVQMGEKNINPLLHSVTDWRRVSGKYQVWITLASNSCFIEHTSIDSSGNPCGGLMGRYSETCRTAKFWCQRGTAVVTSVEYYLTNYQVCTTPEPTLTPDVRTPTATFTASPTLSATFQTATAVATLLTPPPLSTPTMSPDQQSTSVAATVIADLTATSQAGGGVSGPDQTATAQSSDATATVRATSDAGYKPEAPRDCSSSGYVWTCGGSCRYVTQGIYDPNCPQREMPNGGSVGFCPVGYVPDASMCAGAGGTSTPVPEGGGLPGLDGINPGPVGGLPTPDPDLFAMPTPIFTVSPPDFSDVLTKTDDLQKLISDTLSSPIPVPATLQAISTPSFTLPGVITGGLSPPSKDVFTQPVVIDLTEPVRVTVPVSIDWMDPTTATCDALRFDFSVITYQNEYPQWSDHVILDYPNSQLTNTQAISLPYIVDPNWFSYPRWDVVAYEFNDFMIFTADDFRSFVVNHFPEPDFSYRDEFFLKRPVLIFPFAVPPFPSKAPIVCEGVFRCTMKFFSTLIDFLFEAIKWWITIFLKCYDYGFNVFGTLAWYFVRVILFAAAWLLLMAFIMIVFWFDLIGYFIVVAGMFIVFLINLPIALVLWLFFMSIALVVYGAFWLVIYLINNPIQHFIVNQKNSLYLQYLAAIRSNDSAWFPQLFYGIFYGISSLTYYGSLIIYWIYELWIFFIYLIDVLLSAALYLLCKLYVLVYMLNQFFHRWFDFFEQFATTVSDIYCAGMPDTSSSMCSSTGPTSPSTTQVLGCDIAAVKLLLRSLVAPPASGGSSKYLSYLWYLATVIYSLRLLKQALLNLFGLSIPTISFGNSTIPPSGKPPSDKLPSREE